VVEVYAKRLQIQEKVSAQIATAINTVLQPQRRWGDHQGLASLHDHARVGKLDADLVTSRMLGCFRNDSFTRWKYLSMVT